MLNRGDQLPHFEVTAADGSRFRYETVWQRKHLILVSLPAETDPGVAATLSESTAEFATYDAVCVVTDEPLPGIGAHGVLIADRWGEIAHVATGGRISDLADAADLIEWAKHLQHRCPECEGEAR